MAARDEGTEPLDALVDERRGAVEVAAAPVMESDADLKDAVIQTAVGSARRAPEELERLVLLEELALVELLDALDQLGRRGLVAPCADGLVDGAAGTAFLLWPGGLAVATRPTPCVTW